MSPIIDLHIHTSVSDGLSSPSEVLDMVRERELAAFSITDHDTLDGYHAVGELLSPEDPELIVGVELSVLIEGSDLHLLAYLFDPDDETFNTSLTTFQKERDRRGRLITEKLGKLGLELPYDAVLESAGNSVVGRPHIAEALHRLKLTASYNEAFQKYIGKDGPAYVPKAKMTPEEAIRLIHNAGGVAVMAHPLLDNMIRYLEQLVDFGLDGIEVYHYTTADNDIRHIKRLAKRYKLVLSGGSDYHGRGGRTESIGSQPVPVDYLFRLKERAAKIRGEH
jgi:predicted metal-dependent phosphoesterase TrpH